MGIMTFIPNRPQKKVLMFTPKLPAAALSLIYFPPKAGKSSEETDLLFLFLPSDSQMEIVCEHQQFRILVDGQPLCGFTHRLSPLASLTALRVFGDLQLTKVA